MSFLLNALFAVAVLLGMLPAHGADARTQVREAMADPVKRAGFAAEGARAAFFCTNCHGENGISTMREVPNLAAQHPDYLLDQIEAFLSGKRKDDFMQGLMKVLNEDEKARIAVFYATALPRPAIAEAGPRAAEGAAHYAKLCARCHRDDAGGDASFPRLAGQQPEYLRTSLRRYMDMSGERLYPPMTGAVRQLGPGNIDAVVEYLSSLR